MIQLKLHFFPQLNSLFYIFKSVLNGAVQPTDSKCVVRRRSDFGADQREGWFMTSAVRHCRSKEVNLCKTRNYQRTKNISLVERR